MRQVTISQLKNRLSAYLKRAQGGESILVLDRDRPIAMLEKVNATEHPDSRLDRLERAGAVHASRTANPLSALSGTRPPRARVSVVEALVDERRHGR